MAELGAVQPSPSPTDSTRIPPLPHIHSLPIDIMYCIYLACHAEDPRHFATTASHVCRSWRGLALGAAVFWTQLIFTRNRLSVEKNATWAERSGEVLVDVEITEKAFDKASVKTARAVLHLLKAERRRLRSFNVHREIPMKIRRMLFDGLRYVEAPKLEELRIEMDEEYESRRWRPRAFEAGAPSLRRLAIKRREFDWSSSFVTGLTAFRISAVPGLTPLVAYDVLARASQMKSLSLMMWDEVDPSWETAALDSFTPTPAIHHSLTYLQAPPKILNALQQQFRFPALRHLHIYDSECWDPPLGPLPPLNDVYPDLRRLTLHAWTGGDSRTLETKLNDYLVGFATMTSITTVAFDRIYWTSEDGVGSIFGRFGKRYPPRTDTIIVDEEVESSSYIGPSLSVVKDLVESRMDVEGIVPIRHLSLKLRDWEKESNKEDEVLEWLRSNIEDFHVGGPSEMEEESKFWGDI